ncbi:MAG: tRNA (N(6)-L-threonylcarbamoyladenosine(37)-C(2))-methylthiotransferase MtaB [Defluviitaleaceae bacterium]|nr:tRNA (N(6)-L-threonylcarbamoyladenosine(37)-C(2))-methylthiotransferase MtaB [Defluviitaleaceae bacterium]
MDIAIHTLGCKVNRCDADSLAAGLRNLGHNVFSGAFKRRADVFVVNTCTVTHTGDKKSLQMLRRARRLNPGAFVAMCGCLAKATESAPPAEADFVFDARKPDDFISQLEKISATHFIKTPGLPAQADKLRTRSFIKIQDGCDRFCSYCIVPLVRGPLVSLPEEEILSKAKALIAAGTPEIVLTGIQAASYGYDTGKGNLPALIKKTAALYGLKRLRLSSTDPWAVTADFLEAVETSPVLCSHFHLSLQSGCDNILKKMNRRYTTAEYAKAAESLRKLRPEAALTTDMIVGFPGESDSDFAESLSFVRKMKFANMHVFEFSPRKGTPAAEFPAQTSHKIKSERGKIMRELAEELQADFLNLQIGKTLDVLFETKTKGHSANYCPVEVLTPENLASTIQKVTITSREGDCLKGEFDGNPKNQHLSS